MKKLKNIAGIALGWLAFVCGIIVHALPAKLALLGVSRVLPRAPDMFAA